MAKKPDNSRMRNAANITSIAMLVFLSAAFIFETLWNNIEVSYNITGFAIGITLLVVILIIRNSINHYKMALNVPIMLFIFYTFLMFQCKWNNSHYLFICISLCAISCLYSSFHRTLAYIIATNIAIAVMFFRGDKIGGHDATELAILINWAISLFSCIIMLVLTRIATIILNRALEQRNSFNDLLGTTENYVAMINERNEVVYASKTLAVLGNTEEPELVQGRPLIDVFPGRSLKIQAGKLLKEKDDYAGDWEFTLDGQKRYFKAISHSLPGSSGGSLISLYDMTHLAERDEIAAMKDSMQIGLFFMDKNYIIQDHYSRHLELMLSDTKLFGKVFTDVIAASVSTNELNAIKDYFKMILERTYDQEMLEDINPL
ncbi:MAG: hypothetical protein FWD13_05710, partial [Treponema sp.]|nr:hypothetical protein [Treponema sp.]